MELPNLFQNKELLLEFFYILSFEQLFLKIKLYGEKFGQFVKLIRAMEKVSVIIPCYNSGKTIEQTVKSIEKQTWSNIELIIVNDGSDDDYTLNVLSKFKNAKIIYQKNSGLSSARNKGLANAKGNYVFFLDADDWIEIDAISKMMECMKYSNSSILFPDTILEDERKV